jgi:hypothetical protein
MRAERPAVVSELWLQGVSYAHIVRVLGCAHSTVRRDIVAARLALQLDHLATINQRLVRSLAVWRLVQKRIWELYARVDDRSVNKSAVLNIVSQAEERTSRLGDIPSPDCFNAAALVEAWKVMTDTTMGVCIPVRCVHVRRARDGNSDCKPGGKRWTILDTACAERRRTQHRRTSVNVGGQQEQNKNIWLPVGE